MQDFEIMPFEFLPPHLRWAYGQFVNKEAGWTEFETVDDVDFELDDTDSMLQFFRMDHGSFKNAWSTC